MNAPLERGNENTIKVQLAVLFDEIMGGAATEKTYARFRVASKYLPEEARAAWVRVEAIGEKIANAEGGPETLNDAERKEIRDLKDILDAFAIHLEAFMESFDPETYEAYTDALQRDDVPAEDNILEQWARLRSRTLAENEVD